MGDRKKTKAQLIAELEKLRQRNAELEKAEEELRKFKLISDRANYGAAIGDIEGNIIYSNNTWAKFHGYEVDELVGKHFSICHTENQLEHVNKLMEKLFENGFFTAEESYHVKKRSFYFYFFDEL